MSDPGVRRQPSRRTFLRTAAASALAAPFLARGQAARRPNVIFFLVDDLGWMDCGAFGSRYYETPHIDRLAARGMLFTDAYSASPLCSPTRGSIVTGQHPARLGITTAAGHQPPEPPDASRYPAQAAPNTPVLLPASLRFLEPSQVTIAERFREAGYRTAHIGKWHLGLNPEHWPEAQGFEVSFHGAPDPGPPSYHSPYGFKAGTVTDGPEGEYITDRLTDEALKFIAADDDRPFLLHLWQYGVHGPWGHKAAYTQEFVGKDDPRGAQANPIMASMLKSVDESLGRVMAKLDELGLADDTVIIFFSDNGGNVHSNTETDRRTVDLKPTNPNYARIQDWRKYAGFQPPTNNAPLRKGKSWLYEGGVRVPLIVSWPGRVAAGSQCHEPVQSVDFYPTLLQLAGLPPTPDHPLDGVSLMPLLRQDGDLDRETLFWYFPHGGPTQPPGVSVRQGDWKLIRWYLTSPDFPRRHELYNLAEDISEKTDLASQMPDKVAELDALLERFLKDTKAVVPIPNPAYQPAPPNLQGWQAFADTTAALGPPLRLVATGKRTQMMQRDVPEASGELVLKFRITAAAGQGGIVYWTDPAHAAFNKDMRSDFTLQADGEWHEYAAPFRCEGRLTGLRFDASVVPTTVQVAWIRLCQADGTVLREWGFE